MNRPTIQLPKVLAAWGTPAFTTVLKAELERLEPAALPLQQGLSRGSYVSGDRFQVMVISVSDADDAIRIKAGIHYQSIIAGCSCADDPTPIDALSEYCQVAIVLDRTSATVQVSLVDD